MVCGMNKGDGEESHRFIERRGVSKENSKKKRNRRCMHIFWRKIASNFLNLV